MLQEPKSSRAVRAGEPRAVGRLMKRVWHHWLVLILLPCCGDTSKGVNIPPGPPDQSDQATELRRGKPEPSMPQMVEAPDPEVVGCFQVRRPERIAGKYWPVPSLLKLSDRRAPPGHARLDWRYRAIPAVSDTFAREGRWYMFSDHEVNATFSNEDVTWKLELHRTTEGLAGTARQTVTYSVPFEVEVQFHKAPCQ